MISSSAFISTYVPLRRETFEREAVYIVIGIKPNGHKEVIDYCIAPNENIEVWTEPLQSMKSRGLEQVELFLSDGVVGMKTALTKTYPQAHFQRCLVHVMRNICAKVRVEDRETIMNEFKQIHQQPNKEAAIKVLHAFYDKWNRAYNHVIRNLKEIEPDLLVFYSYPKPKAEFPTEQSLDTFIGIQAMSYNDRYFNRIHKGFGQVQDTLESYFD